MEGEDTCLAKTARRFPDARLVYYIITQRIAANPVNYGFGA